MPGYVTGPKKHPAAEALVSNGRRIDYAELERLVDECARAFATRGIARGDRVAVLCTTRWESFVMFYALCRLGAAWVGLNPRHKLSELQYVVEDSAPTTLIGMAGFEDRDYRTELIALSTQCPSIRQSIALTGKIAGFDSFKAILNSATEIDDADYREAIDEVSGEDAACVVYTSGSTGKPKGALLPQRGLIAVQTGMAELYSVQPFRALNNFPMDHVGGLTDIALLGLVQGGTIILQETLLRQRRLRRDGRRARHDDVSDGIAVPRLRWIGRISRQRSVEPAAHHVGRRAGIGGGRGYLAAQMRDAFVRVRYDRILRRHDRDDTANAAGKHLHAHRPANSRRRGSTAGRYR